MGDRKFTFVELHFDGEAQFSPRSISDIVGGGLGSSGSEETTTEDETEEIGGAPAEDEEGGGRSAIGAGIALVVLVGLALAVRKYRGGEESDEHAIEEHEEPDVVVD